MLVGVLSDIHDNIKNLETVLDILKERKADRIVFCGDFCAPFAARKLAESNMEVDAVFGNNDGDRFTIRTVTAEFNNFRLHGEYIGDIDNQLIINDIRIGVTHYPFYAKPMIKTGWYDCVFYGHNHKADKQMYAGNLLMNPGEVAGIFNKPSFAVIDTVLKSSEIVWL